ncbi:MAG: hypothetical protein AAF281_00080 [Pseudomonadota bacterium]
MTAKFLQGPGLRAVLVLTAAAGFALSPLLLPGFGGFEAEDFPVPQIDPPVVPAGYAFAIWGLIYLWLIVHGAWGLLRHADDPGWDRTRLPLIVSLTVGIGWLPVAVADPLAATVMIWVMLAGALAGLLQAPPGAMWTLGVPLGLYAGWLTAASSVALALVGAGYGLGPGQDTWAWIGLAVAASLALAVQIRPATPPAYALAAAWALIAIAVRNGLAPLSAASVLLALLLLATAFRRPLARRLRRR